MVLKSSNFNSNLCKEFYSTSRNIEKSVNLLHGNMAGFENRQDEVPSASDWLPGQANIGLVYFLTFIELVSAHKSAKKEKKEKEFGQHPTLG